MPEYLSPGVYVEEVSGGIKPIEGVGTSTGAFIGVAEKGPIAGAQYEDGVASPVLITNFTEFTRNFGGFVKGEFLAYAVRQFFGEGGTRCFVARTAHFSNPTDRSSLTAKRAVAPLTGGISTTLAADPAAGAPTIQATSAAGIAAGMEFVISEANARARVRVTNVSGANLDVTALDPTALPDFGNGASVDQVLLEVRAINEGEWGNNLRVACLVSGRVKTSLAADLDADEKTATLTSVADIQPGLELFINNATAGARVRVSEVDRSAKTITFQNIAPAATPEITMANSNVSGVNVGKVSTVLDGAVAKGATEAVLQSTEGIEPGSVLLFISESLSPLQVLEDRVVVQRVIGKRVILASPLGGNFPGSVTGYPDKTRVITEDFTIQVYDRDEVVETFTNLSLDNAHVTDYVEARINSGAAKSKYIRVKEMPATTDNRPPISTTAPLRLTGGVNGEADDAGDYIGDPAAQNGFFAFDSIDDINIVAAPGITMRAVPLAGMTYCENRKDCFFVAEAPQAAQTVSAVLEFKNGAPGQQALNSKYGALYWPWVKGLDPLTNREISLPPSGAVIGTYSATDVKRGVHKAPAGADDGFLNTVTGVDKVVTKGEHDLLNPKGVNVIRSIPDVGIVIWGARTTSSDPEWKYVNVRRLFLFLEESIDQGTQWVVFEPNDKTLWKRITRNISAFLTTQWREGALVGDKPEKAFFVKCDEETNPPESVDLGRVVTIIGVAPSKPAEFVIFRIMQARPGEA